MSAAKQVAVLGLGLGGAAVIAGVLGHVSDQTNPIWVLPVIASGFVCFLGYLATTAWTVRSTVGLASRPVLTGGRYLASLLLVGGVVAWASDTPTAAHVTPLALAGVLVVLALLGGVRRRARMSHTDALRRGTHVQGTVTDDGLAEFPDTPNLKLATLAVTFRDLSGVQRWVSVQAAQAPGRPVEVGQLVDVWFDSAAPDDLSKIVVDHDNGASRIVQVRPERGS